MKTTIEISDALLAQARALASEEETTLRALVEEGLREMLKCKNAKPSFRLRKASFKGQGLQLGFASDRWDAIRDAAYQGRGG